MADPELVVLKLGGSLLDLEGLRDRLLGVLGRYRPSRIMVVVGGGAAADLVRGWDRLHQLGDETAHVLALGAMTFNARFVSRLLGHVGLEANPRECERSWQLERLAVINPARLVPSLEAAQSEPLPHTWEATSDSISAWIASCLGADRLVLLKSRDAPSDGLCASGDDLVDPAFSRMCRRVRCVEWINLRAATPQPSDVRFR